MQTRPKEIKGEQHRLWLVLNLKIIPTGKDHQERQRPQYQKLKA